MQCSHNILLYSRVRTLLAQKNPSFFPPCLLLCFCSSLASFLQSFQNHTAVDKRGTSLLRPDRSFHLTSYWSTNLLPFCVKSIKSGDSVHLENVCLCDRDNRVDIFSWYMLSVWLWAVLERKPSCSISRLAVFVKESGP